MKLISIVTPCYNEEENIELLSTKVSELFEGPFSNYDYEHIFIDNNSSDDTINILRKLAEDNKKIKVILNSRNFGHIRSHVHGYLAAEGDAVIVFFCDLQDPPELIYDFIKKWEEGHNVIVGIKSSSEENP